jgi:hypothetical protein
MGTYPVSRSRKTKRQNLKLFKPSYLYGRGGTTVVCWRTWYIAIHWAMSPSAWTFFASSAVQSFSTPLRFMDNYRAPAFRLMAKEKPPATERLAVSVSTSGFRLFNDAFGCGQLTVNVSLLIAESSRVTTRTWPV